MPTNVHQLDPEKHQSFLAQKRRDPVTGDPIQSGDQIVICAVCQSAFLKESWDYLGQKHCGQQETAREIREARALKLQQAELGAPLYPRIDTLLYAGLQDKAPKNQVLILAGMLFGILGQLIATGGQYSPMVALILLFTFLAILAPTLLLKYKGISLPRLMSRFGSCRTLFHEEGIELLGGGKKYHTRRLRYQSIEHIHMVGLMSPSLRGLQSWMRAPVMVEIKLKSGELIQAKVSDTVFELRKASQMLLDLHEKVTISFSVDDIGDYKRLLRQVQEAGADIEVRRLENSESVLSLLRLRS